MPTTGLCYSCTYEKLDAETFSKWGLRLGKGWNHGHQGHWGEPESEPRPVPLCTVLGRARPRLLRAPGQQSGLGISGKPPRRDWHRRGAAPAEPTPLSLLGKGASAPVHGWEGKPVTLVLETSPWVCFPYYSKYV